MSLNCLLHHTPGESLQPTVGSGQANEFQLQQSNATTGHVRIRRASRSESEQIKVEVK